MKPSIFFLFKVSYLFIYLFIYFFDFLKEGCFFFLLLPFFFVCVFFGNDFLLLLLYIITISFSWFSSRLKVFVSLAFILAFALLGIFIFWPY